MIHPRRVRLDGLVPMAFEGSSIRSPSTRRRIVGSSTHRIAEPGRRSLRGYRGVAARSRRAVLRWRARRRRSTVAIAMELAARNHRYEHRARRVRLPDRPRSLSTDLDRDGPRPRRPGVVMVASTERAHAPGTRPLAANVRCLPASDRLGEQVPGRSSNSSALSAVCRPLSVAAVSLVESPALDYANVLATPT
jgi:hypothetical protein